MVNFSDLDTSRQNQLAREQLQSSGMFRPSPNVKDLRMAKQYLMDNPEKMLALMAKLEMDAGNTSGADDGVAKQVDMDKAISRVMEDEPEAVHNTSEESKEYISDNGKLDVIPSNASDSDMEAMLNAFIEPKQSKIPDKINRPDDKSSDIPMEALAGTAVTGMMVKDQLSKKSPKVNKDVSAMQGNIAEIPAKQVDVEKINMPVEDFVDIKMNPSKVKKLGNSNASKMIPLIGVVANQLMKTK